MAAFYQRAILLHRVAYVCCALPHRPLAMVTNFLLLACTQMRIDHSGGNNHVSATVLAW